MALLLHPISSRCCTKAREIDALVQRSIEAIQQGGVAGCGHATVVSTWPKTMPPLQSLSKHCHSWKVAGDLLTGPGHLLGAHRYAVAGCCRLHVLKGGVATAVAVEAPMLL